MIVVRLVALPPLDRRRGFVEVERRTPAVSGPPDGSKDVELANVS